eukprot:jgi/Mesen1/7899/ME000420S07048
MNPDPGELRFPAADAAAGAEGGGAPGGYNVELRQVVPTKPRMMEALALTPLAPPASGAASPGGGVPLLLALGGLDNRVHLLTAVSPLHPFVEVCQLAGHQDWIRCLDFSYPLSSSTLPPPQHQHPQQQEQQQPLSLPLGAPEGGEGQGHTLLLASASQDRNIRVWKLSPLAASEGVGSGGAAAAAGAASPSGVLGEVSRLGLYSKGPTFRVGAHTWQVELESLLVGHEDWVHSARWHPPVRSQAPGGGKGASPGTMTGGSGSSSPSDEEGESAGKDKAGAGAGAGARAQGLGEGARWQQEAMEQPVCLLSASMDRSMMIWRPDRGAGGLWVNEVNVGELGHYALGFYGGLWSPWGDAILAHAYGGSLHLWRDVGAAGGDRWRAISGGGVGDTGAAAPVPASVPAPAAAGDPPPGASEGASPAALVAEEEQEEEGESRAGVSGSGSDGSRNESGGGAPAVVRRDAVGAGAGQEAGARAGASEAAAAAGNGGGEERRGEPDWRPQAVPSGHFAAVVDIAWDKTSHFLLSASHDQTTRVLACWDWSRSHAANGRRSWHEIARPQVHGHDMSCAALLRTPGNHAYVSGAEEKVARVFEAPGAFLDTLGFTLEGGGRERLAGGAGAQVAALGAAMSALGLSQKPIFAEDRHVAPTAGSSAAAEGTDFGGMDPLEAVPEALPGVTTEPPLEEHLAQNTLWPESQKLYGHGNELFCLAADNGGRLLASACKAQSASVAEVWLWDTATWRAVGQLQAHTLTVTQMEFSPSDRFLLCVSRDRHLSVFERTEGEGGCPYRLLTRMEAHKRIVWTASWAPCGAFFATGSRDKLAKVWCVSERDGNAPAEVALTCTLPTFRSSVTALTWAPQELPDKAYILAVGTEEGGLSVWQGRRAPQKSSSEQDTQSITMTLMHEVDPFLCHVATVHRLRWRAGPPLEESGCPPEGNEEELGQVRLQLASCGADHAVRLTNIIYQQ